MLTVTMRNFDIEMNGGTQIHSPMKIPVLSPAVLYRNEPGGS